MIDRLGEPVRDAPVTISKNRTGEKSVRRADEQGRTSLEGIAQGDHDITATAPGYIGRTARWVGLPANVRLQVDLGMVGDVIVKDPHDHPIRHFFARVKNYLNL